MRSKATSNLVFVPIDPTDFKHRDLDASSAVANAPDGLVTVFAEEQTAVFGDANSDRATPDFAIGRDEAGHEVFVFAARY
jgi:hypothetical protein